MLHTYNTKLYCLISIILLSCIACNTKPEEVPFAPNYCAAMPPFVKRIFPGKTNIAFSTNERIKYGLHIVELRATQGLPDAILYQDSSWKMAGWLGPLVTDNRGNVWVAPAPTVNILLNPTKEQNNLYRVDPNTGTMELYLQLPMPDSITNQNPYGILGLAYNCNASVLYVSSVAGSTRSKQLGAIYAINTTEKKIIATLNCGDAMGMAVSTKEGYRKLYFGTARNSTVYSVGLASDGTFQGGIQEAFSIQGLGPRGDDKVKKIKEDNQGILIVTGYEFNYNLTAPTEKQENKYEYIYNPNTLKWEQKNY